MKIIKGREKGREQEWDIETERVVSYHIVKSDIASMHEFTTRSKFVQKCRLRCLFEQLNYQLNDNKYNCTLTKSS